MTLHLSCAAGFEHIVAYAIQKDIGQLGILAKESGFLSVSVADHRAPAVATRPYVAGVSQLLAEVGHQTMDVDALRLAARLPRTVKPADIGRFRSFRVRIMDSGHLVAIDHSSRQRLEEEVSRWGTLRPCRGGADVEFWVTHRRGHRTSTLSASLLTSSKRSLRKGSLKPDVAAALVRAVSPRPSDVFLDPFAGSGAILQARSSYPHAAILGCDIDPAAVNHLRTQRNGGVFGWKAEVFQTDTLDTSTTDHYRLRHLGVTTIVTDPPWGVFHETSTPLEEFYVTMWRSFDDILEPGSKAVVLTGASAEAEAAMELSEMRLEQSTSVLINGRKANLLIAKRAQSLV